MEPYEVSCAASFRSRVFRTSAIRGSNGFAAKEDLYGGGYRGGIADGYQDLVSKVGPEHRIIVNWCWQLFFSLLLIVPSELKVSIRRAIEADTSWLRPLMRRFEIVP